MLVELIHSCEKKALDSLWKCFICGNRLGPKNHLLRSRLDILVELSEIRLYLKFTCVSQTLIVLYELRRDVLMGCRTENSQFIKMGMIL